MGSSTKRREIAFSRAKVIQHGLLPDEDIGGSRCSVRWHGSSPADRLSDLRAKRVAVECQEKD
jgi:hypothetical protein